MNFKTDLSKKHQNLLTQINYSVLDKEYSKDEIRKCINDIADHCMSLSSKNDSISNEMQKYDELMTILIKNEN